MSLSDESVINTVKQSQLYKQSLAATHENVLEKYKNMIDTIAYEMYKKLKENTTLTDDDIFRLTIENVYYIIYDLETNRYLHAPKPMMEGISRARSETA